MIPFVYDPERHGDYLDVAECARRMNLTNPQVMDLVRRGALRSIPDGLGEILVQPAIINVTPAPKNAPGRNRKKWLSTP